MRFWARWVLALVLAAVAVGGLLRLRVSTDVLEMIPSEAAGVAGLKRLNRHLADERMLLVLIEAEEEDGVLDDAAVEALAARFETVEGTARVLSPTDGVDEAGGFADVVGYLWMNGDPVAFESIFSRLKGAGLNAALAQAKRTLMGSFDEMAIARAGYDPLGFTERPLLAWTEENLRSLMANDGSATLLRVEAETSLGGYKDYGAWMERLRAAVAAEEEASAPGWRVSLTGSPAFAAEIGGAMEKDMAGTTGAAGFLIVGLFLILQRSLRQLVAIALCMGVTLALTLAAFGWVIGDLGVVSGGFAAILMGLTVDYAMILSREIHASGGDRLEGRRRARQGIVWGSVTTAAPFAVLMTSAMPGGRQLGFLVMAGLLIGAVVMLGWFPALAFGKGGGGGAPRTPSLPTLGPKLARRVALVLGVLAVGLGGWLGQDARLSFDLKMLRPENSAAMEALERAQARFPAWDEGSVHVLATEGRALDWTALEDGVAKLKAEGVLSGAFLPKGLLPDEDRFRANAERLRKVPEDLAVALESGLEEAGFTEKAGVLAKEILAGFERDATGTAAEAFERARRHPLLGGQVLVEAGEPSLAVGAVRLGVDLDEEVNAKLRALNETGVTLTSWPMLGPEVQSMLAADISRTLVPMFIALAVALLIALRNWREAALAVGLLVLGLLWVFVLMGLRSGTHEFLFLDVIGLVLLMGVGLDYTLHLIFALRREGGDVGPVMRSTGTAIAFCAVSTAIGFGSLTLASNRALAGLGWLAGGGILLLALLILGLLPGLWRRVGGSGRRT